MTHVAGPRRRGDAGRRRGRRRAAARAPRHRVCSGRSGRRTRVSSPRPPRTWTGVASPSVIWDHRRMDETTFTFTGDRRHRDLGLPLGRGRRAEGDRADRPRHGRARRPVPPAGRGPHRRRVRRVRQRPSRPRPHGRHPRTPRRPRRRWLAGTRRRPGRAQRPCPPRAPRHPARARRPQHGLVRPAVLPARPQRRPRRRRPLGHLGTGRHLLGHRPDPGGRPQRLQRPVRTGADRVRLAQPRPRRGRPLRRRSGMRVRAQPRQHGQHAGRRGRHRRTANASPASARTCPSTCCRATPTPSRVAAR